MHQIAVIGLGRFGFHVTKLLHAAGHEVLAVDSNPTTVQRIKDDCARAVVLDARDKDRLRALGLKDFDTVVLSLSERIDASVLVSLHLKEIGVRDLIAKASSSDHAKLLELIGVDRIIFPERQAAERLSRRLTDTLIVDYIPLGDRYSIHELATPADYIGKTLEELELRRRYRVQVLAVRDVLTDDMIVNPGPQFTAKDSDVLIILGANEDLKRIQEANTR